MSETKARSEELLPTKRFQSAGWKIVCVIMLLAIPAIFNHTARSFERTRFGTDPESAYLFNALNLNIGKPVGHFDHPGTTAQVFYAVAMRLVYWYRNPAIDIQTDVLTHSENYIESLRHADIFLAALVLFFLGLFAWWKFKNVWVGLLLQSFPFTSATVSEHMFTKVAPEPFLLIATCLLIVLMIQHYTTPKSRWADFPFLYGMLGGFGLATKFVFLPMLVIPLGILQGKKQRLTYLFVVPIAFLLFTSPAVKGYAGMAKWVFDLGTHTGTYGQGAKGVVNWAEYFSSWAKIVEVNWVMATCILISALVLSVLFLASRRHKVQSFDITQRYATSVLVGLLMSILLVAKHYHSNHYLFPSLVMLGFEVFLIVQLLANRFKVRHRHLLFSAVWLGACGLVWLTKSNLAIAKQGYHDTNIASHECDKWLQSNFATVPKVYFYPTGLREYASLRWGNVYARQMHEQRLMELFPQAFFYNAIDNKFEFWDSQISTDEIASRFNKHFLLVGGPLDDEGFNKMLSKGFKLNKLYGSRGQVVYEVDSTSGLFNTQWVDEPGTKIVRSSFESVSADTKYILDDKGQALCENTSLRPPGHSGQKSLLIPPGGYGMNVPIHDAKPGSEIVASIWVKGASDAHLVLHTEGNKFYVQTSTLSVSQDSGWHKLDISATIPSDNLNGLMFYLWNNDKIPAGFDDFQMKYKTRD